MHQGMPWWGIHRFEAATPGLYATECKQERRGCETQARLSRGLHLRCTAHAVPTQVQPPCAPAVKTMHDAIRTMGQLADTSSSQTAVSGAEGR